jgi:hypothetical protein
MLRRATHLQRAISIPEVAKYHRDAESSLRLYFTSDNPSFVARFAGYVPSKVEEELADRIGETDMRSALAIMTRIEAAFRIDYQMRCRRKETDGVSVAFRRLKRTYGEQYWRVPLERMIFETWRTVYPETSNLISELNGAFRFRHWLAHGRYFQPKLARKYDYQGLYVLAVNVMAQFPLLAENA